ncbi:17665_t:CDS:2 [Gigaspora margarita]|uniref:17665_t:CDS:1 n=1 Tax=Gigaspora margarita TaxID=4874 RepID=A0ABN7UII1_GIGMA|nr:17665_t:CDS:2 [Gigaspora margarita]
MSNAECPTSSTPGLNTSIMFDGDQSFGDPSFGQNQANNFDTAGATSVTIARTPPSSNIASDAQCPTSSTPGLNTSFMFDGGPLPSSFNNDEYWLQLYLSLQHLQGQQNQSNELQYEMENLDQTQELSPEHDQQFLQDLQFLNMRTSHEENNSQPRNPSTIVLPGYYHNLLEDSEMPIDTSQFPEYTSRLEGKIKEIN